MSPRTEGYGVLLRLSRQSLVGLILVVVTQSRATPSLAELARSMTGNMDIAQAKPTGDLLPVSALASPPAGVGVCFFCSTGRAPPDRLFATMLRLPSPQWIRFARGLLLSAVDFIILSVPFGLIIPPPPVL
jgi:hypothetical protein